MWAIYAIVASFFWGITYVCSGEIYKQASVPGYMGISYMIIGLTCMAIAGLSGRLASDLALFAEQPRLLSFLLAGACSSLIAAGLTGLAMSMKDATLVGLIEISYPIFIALIAWVMFRSTVTLPTMIGGAVVFVGVGIIFWFNR